MSPGRIISSRYTGSVSAVGYSSGLGCSGIRGVGTCCCKAAATCAAKDCCCSTASWSSGDCCCSTASWSSGGFGGGTGFGAGAGSGSGFDFGFCFCFLHKGSAAESASSLSPQVFRGTRLRGPGCTLDGSQSKAPETLESSTTASLGHPTGPRGQPHACGWLL